MFVMLVYAHLMETIPSCDNVTLTFSLKYHCEELNTVK
jgi:hypothetical protein